MNEMFCFQCEQTAGGIGCGGRAGVCGKKASTALLQDELIGALVTLAQAALAGNPGKQAADLVTSGLFATITNANFNDSDLEARIDEVKAEAARLGNAAPAFPMENVWDEPDEDIRSLKSLILFGLKGMAAYAYHACALGYTDDKVTQFFYEALNAIGSSHDADELLACALSVGEHNLGMMELLDRANTETYGDPVPVEVPLTIEKGPFIVVSGHDFKDLQEILEQTQGKGVNVYTHGEMLPAHGYPKLKAYKHLKGNFGTAWQNQQREFKDIPAPIVFTTNCLMPPRDSYADRVFTTEVVSYPGMVHVGSDKDFAPVIEKALELGGYPEDTVKTGINGGTQVTVGYARNTMLSAAGAIVDAVKAKAINHFFLMGGCDGAHKERAYYTEFAKATPQDSVILTLACGKYRFNDLDLGQIGEFPRLLDMGQCNDAFGGIRVAIALAEAFECEVNDLPLSFVISWYEQKAVAVLLTLLYLGIEDIYLGPTLPAFVSSNVLGLLQKNYCIKTISSPEADLRQMLA